MPEFTLTAAPPLAGYSESFGDVTLRAPEEMAIVSLALPLGGEDAALTAIRGAYGVDLPGIGQTAKTSGGEMLMRLAPDMGMVIFTHAKPDANSVVQARLNGAAYTTDQTDVWCALELSGAGSRRVLERICPLDLHEDGFATGEARRTVMEHLGTIIARTGADTWLLMSASSSAGSFLHAIETSIKNAS